ncbi:8-amino-7-oxononanoate synthase [Haliovirga abyssi]|uniref:8-amino-7-ketopelargonate synthase n=1 Tax=Haliovirga abyssi TaxID=2996794 RepID=A0AAU9DQV6_9FUSO|nr:8-amino-7-oxononanoate synthase [Haliovirga abyssi]BDU50893.1 putative 8-amino-7-oxononanoate synthase [Haliovirga abyssi]
MDFFKEELRKIKDLNLFREIKKISNSNGKYIYINGKKYIDFSSNNYLGLKDDERVKDAAIEAIKKYGVGSGASRLVTGTNELYNRLENEISNFKNTEATLLFNSGYDANLGSISTIMDKNDVIFSDKLNHASIIDGIFLSKSKLIRYKHNDINDLEDKLIKNRKNYKKALVITDSIFSMDGDKANLQDIAKLKEKYDFLFMIDEAHGTGIFGKNGIGLAEEQNVLGKVDITMGTLGKSFGTQGAYITGKKDIIEYLVNRCRSFIFTTAIAPSAIGAALKSLEIIKKEAKRREKILRNSDYLRKELLKLGLDTQNSSSQIIPIIIGEEKKALEISQKLFEENLFVSAIRKPTVPSGTARLRISINYNIDKDDIDKLISILKNIL